MATGQSIKIDFGVVKDAEPKQDYFKAFDVSTKKTSIDEEAKTQMFVAIFYEKLKTLSLKVKPAQSYFDWESKDF